MTSKVESRINNSESESNTKKWKKGWVGYRAHGQTIGAQEEPAYFCPYGFKVSNLGIGYERAQVKCWVSIVLRLKENRKRRQH